jgi:hypothetical protein
MMFLYKPSSEWHRRDDLTPGKIYDCEWNGEVVYSSDGIYYELISDLGNKIDVHESHFISLDKVREDKLNKLGI